MEERTKKLRASIYEFEINLKLLKEDKEEGNTVKRAFNSLRHVLITYLEPSVKVQLKEVFDAIDMLLSSLRGIQLEKERTPKEGYDMRPELIPPIKTGEDEIKIIEKLLEDLKAVITENGKPDEIDEKVIGIMNEIADADAGNTAETKLIYKFFNDNGYLLFLKK